jgi:hypothetical protein
MSGVGINFSVNYELRITAMAVNTAINVLFSKRNEYFFLAVPKKKLIHLSVNAYSQSQFS